MRKLILAILTATILVGCKKPAKIDAGLEYAKNRIEELTITQAQSDIKQGLMSCQNLVEAYIERIEAYNPKLNAISYKNYEEARSYALATDNLLASGMQLPKLFCVPILVKDNIDVNGFATTAGSKAMLENYPPDDAEILQNLKGHGVIILAKTNMAEWAFSPKRTKSTTIGITKNAYNLEHVPAGSSGGTASAIAANLALVGLGTDTGNSVRGPSSHLSLVGMRSTHGLLSLDGIVPLVLSADVVGPMTRTVADNVLMFHAMGGEDYQDKLDKTALKGKKIGIVRALADKEDMDTDIADLFEVALQDLSALGAEIIDADIKDVKKHIDASWGCKSFRKDVHEYLTQKGMNAPISDPYQAYDKGIYAPYTKGAWEYFKQGTIDKAVRSDGSECGNLAKDKLRQGIKKAILDAMDRQNLDAIIYPSWTYPPALLSRAEEDYKGDNSQTLAPPTGLPAITVPMGFAARDLPAGLQFLGRDNSEGMLYGFAYAYEQKTNHRRAPSGFGTISKMKKTTKK